MRHLFILLVLFITSAQADIYRSQDQHGNLIFSDQPAVGAEQIELRTAPYRYQVKLKHVIDGDTLLLESGEKVRLIGINTPEVKSRFTEAEPGGKNASTWLQNYLRSPQLWLEYDEQEFDKYDRRLAHVFLESGEYLNATLLEQGLAVLTLIPPNLRYASRLLKAQQTAEDLSKGVWNMPAYQIKNSQSLVPGQSYHGWQRCQLTPKDIGEGRKYMSLIASENLVVAIPKSQLDLFPPLENYLDQSLEVRGWISRRGSQHRILVQHPSTLIIH